eukprot:symbB.v1.2.006021.t1/scaffold356.1/size220710/18
MWITVATMCFSEGLAGFRSLPSVSWEARVALFCSVISAVLLNVTQWFAMKAMTSIVGNLNLVLVIALSSAWLHEQVTAWQYLGVMLLCGGTFGNKVQDVLKKASNARPNMEGAENAEKEAPGLVLPKVLGEAAAEAHRKPHGASASVATQLWL